MNFKPPMNRGALFTNQYKKGSRPDLTGSINLNGQVINISAWNVISRNGNPYISIELESVKLPKERDLNIESLNKDELLQSYEDQELDDEIPF